MKRMKQRVVAIFLILLCLIWISGWKRFPTKEEVKATLSVKADEKLTIDTDQSEVGLYWIKIEGEEGLKQEYGIEVVEQWVFPWKQYDFSR